jgi:hypothetical protein
MKRFMLRYRILVAVVVFFCVLIVGPVSWSWYNSRERIIFDVNGGRHKLVDLPYNYVIWKAEIVVGYALLFSGKCLGYDFVSFAGGEEESVLTMGKKLK